MNKLLKIWLMILIPCVVLSGLAAFFGGAFIAVTAFLGGKEGNQGYIIGTVLAFLPFLIFIIGSIILYKKTAALDFTKQKRRGLAIGFFFCIIVGYISPFIVSYTYTGIKTLIERPHEGVNITYYPSGAKLYENIYHKGKLDGVQKIYNENGTLSHEMMYKNGKKDGPFKDYDDDGILYLEGFYENNQRTGIWKQYAPDGSLELEARYSDGSLNGITKDYQKGFLREILYKDGTPVQAITPVDDISP